MINIRHATHSDAEDIVRVHYDAVHGLTSSIFYSSNILNSWSPSPTDQSNINRLRQSIEDSERFIAVAESVTNDVIIGFGIVIPSKQEIHAVYVDSAFAGQGIGSRILLKLEEIALVHGANKLYLDGSLNAERFYFNHGYSLIKRGTHQLNSGTIMDCVHMSKDLRTYQ